MRAGYETGGGPAGDRDVVTVDSALRGSPVWWAGGQAVCSRHQGAGSSPHRVVPPGANPCEHKGKCINTLGSFECQCLQGYTGPRCEIDVNECVSNPCQNDATCLDQIGEFQCICMPGAWGLPDGEPSRARPPLGAPPASTPIRPQPPPASGETERGQAWRAESGPEWVGGLQE